MEKQEIWNSIAATVDRTCDTLRMPVDPGIKETVITLQAMGFNTTSSCEGHDDHGLPYPWIKIDSEEGAGWVDDDVRMAEYLEEFYANHHSLKWAHLSLDYLKDRFILQSFIGKAAKKLKKVNPAEYQLLRKNCTEEMRLFTAFLKEKFWNQ
jgi:hypothetical protein